MLEFIYKQTNELRGYKNEKSGEDFSSPRLGTPNRAVLEPILRELERLWELLYWIPDLTKKINLLVYKRSKEIVRSKK